MKTQDIDRLPYVLKTAESPNHLSRRNFLWVTGGAAAALVLGLPACTSSSPSTDVGPVAAGTKADYLIGTIKLFDAGPVFVGRDSGGLYAMSAICTHQGCTLNVGSESLPCLCHGSVFGLTGSVLTGPANSPLEHYAVTLDAQGAVTVDTAQVVAATARTAV